MSDRIVRALVRDSNVLVLACVATDASREARRRHALASSSAALLAEGITTGVLLAALQKAEKTRINLQVECDGPARGMFVDADTSGRVRGYVRNKTVRFPTVPRFASGTMLGSKGYVSVLRDIDGQFYRGSVELIDPELTHNLEYYFAQSEQVATAMQVDALAEGEEVLGWVGGVLVQLMPQGEPAVVEDLRAKLRAGGLEQAVRAGTTSAHGLLDALVGGSRLELLLDQQVEYFCPCSKERVLRALATLSNVEVAEMLHQDKKAEIDCDFCGEHYLLTVDDLQGVLDVIDARDAAAEAKPRGGGDGEGSGGTTVH